MEIFLTGFFLSISLCLDLGIVNMAIIETGVEKGFAQALNIGLGSSFGDVIYALLSLFGLHLILKFVFIKWALWLVGTFVLLFMCGHMIIEIFKPSVSNNNKILKLKDLGTDIKYFLNGFGLSLSSPTSIIWFFTVGGSIIAAQPLNGFLKPVYFFAGFFTSSIVWSIFLAYISYKGGQLMKHSIKRIFSIISAIIFLFLAAYVFLNGYKTLM